MRVKTARPVSTLARPVLCVLAVGVCAFHGKPAQAQVRADQVGFSELQQGWSARASVGFADVRGTEDGARPFQPQRFWIGNGVMLALDIGTMAALSELWYSDYEQTSFHFHNDWDNWRQQDKLGHLVTSWGLAKVAGSFAVWSGMDRRRAAWYGGLVSLVYLSQIEVLDGFSAGWGASWTDVAFNLAGAAAGGAQVAHPAFEMITLRYSYRRSDFFDEDVTWLGNAIKDYEGITFWLAVRPSCLAEWWPRWLGFSIGHGASGLEKALPTEVSPHQREWYVGIDLDVLTAIHWPKPWMNRLAEAVSVIRIPAPALKIYPTAHVYPLFR